ncbi:MAG: substrate-binding periplasmic protein [Leucobacter sp.]
MFRRASAGLAAAVFVTVGLAACSSSDSASVPANCEPEHDFTTISEGVLTVSTYPLPPYTNVLDRKQTVDGTAYTVGGTLVGVDGDILADFAANECLELEVHTTAAAAVIPTVQAGAADVGAGNWYRTEERAKIVDLTEPIYADKVAIISPDGASSFAELEGRKVGTVVGYQYVADLRDLFAENLVLYNSPLTMFRALEDGDIDAAVDTVGVGEEFTRENDLVVKEAEPDKAVAASLKPGQSAFIVQKGQDDLLAALNATIDRLRESGRLAEILEEHRLDPAAAEPGDPFLIKD